jgi:hypothetical protein
VQYADRIIFACLLFAGYYTAYLGISRLLVLLVPHRERYGLALPVLINLTLLLLGCALPFFYELARNRYLTVNYTPLQASNWLWTFEETINDGTADPTVISLVLGTAALVLVINLVRVRAEIESVRLEAPVRVKLDDEALSRQDKASRLETAAIS